MKKRRYMGTGLGRRELADAVRRADMELGVSGAMLTESELKFLELIRLEHKRRPPETEGAKFEIFSALFTHNSTAMGGNSFTLKETEKLLSEEVAPAGKTFREICETVGHARAFEIMLTHDGNINETFILELHEAVLRHAVPTEFRNEAGHYRAEPIQVPGLEWDPPGPEIVPHEMRRLLSWYAMNRGKVHPLELAVRFHARFEAVRPFADGNGRVGRLLLNHILQREGYPMVSIPSVLRHRYFEVLEKSRDGNIRPFLELMLELLGDGEVIF